MVRLATANCWVWNWSTGPSSRTSRRDPITASLRSTSLAALAPIRLDTATEILTGIPKADTHNGRRIKVGPDGMLYATVGDAQNLGAPQDPGSLSGKILRMELDGSVPADNAFPGSLVHSLGHRNPQGIAWDRDDQLWAAEFGQNTWDEFNIVYAGANYGWPIVEGIGSDPAFVNPVYQWPTEACGC